MKKFFFGALAALFLVPLAANAQTDRFASLPSVETTQSVSLNLQLPINAGLSYAYELPIARRATIIGRIGADAYAVLGGWPFSDHLDLMITPTIDIEPRFYYGLDRRAGHGRSTAGNSGSFLTLQIKNILPLGYIFDDDLTIFGGTYFTPAWGLRRVWNDHWMFETTVGAYVDVGWRGGYEYGYHLGVRFGYTF